MFNQKFISKGKSLLISEGKNLFISMLKKEKRSRQRTDLVAEQVKQMLQTSNQKLILMVRG